jgi:ferredoxin-NADP reductase
MGHYTHTVTLKARREVAERTLAFHFEKPEGFIFKPGQAIDLNLSIPDPTAGAGIELHTLSLVSAPYQDEIIIATRMRDTAYKRALRQLVPGSPVTLEGPAGMLTLPVKNERPAVLIAGGIGVAPFISMLRQATYERSSRGFALVYSNRRPEDAAYLKDLQTMERNNPNFRLIPTMTRVKDSGQGWTGEVGPIDEAKIEQACEGFSEPLFYLAGPPDMVESMYALLEDMGFDGYIRSEEFYGY